MNIVFCIKSLTAQGGGAERVMVDVVNGLSQRGHLLRVLTFDAPGKSAFYRLDPKIEWIRLKIGKTDAAATVPDTLKRIWILRKTILQMKPDAVVGFMHSMFIPLGIALTGTKIPVVGSEHIVPAHYRKRGPEWMLLLLMPLFVSWFTAVSSQVRTLYPLWIRRKMTPVNNPVTAVSKRRPDVAACGLKPKIILTVGRLEEQKDHATLVDAFALLSEKFPEWDLRIVGEGSQRSCLEKRVLAAGLTDRVSMPGVISDIPSEYAGAQLFVLPSQYESFGLTLAEALAHGLPAVGFKDCPGVNFLIRNGFNGLLVPPGINRSKGLADALCTLMIDQDLRIKCAQNALKLSCAYTLETVLEQWIKLLEGVTAK
jgi:glycosyltransferase involved in cell wall biosynthesis